MGDDAHRRGVVLTARVPGGHGRLGVGARHQRPQGAEPLERRVGTRVLVAIDHPLLATAVDGHRHDLLSERAALLSGERQVVRAQRELVLLGARDPVVPAQVLGGFDHASGHRMVDAAGRHSRPRQPILERHTATLDAPAQTHRIELGLAHALGAAREDDVRRTRLDLHAAEHDRLQARAAAPVELEPRHLDRETGVERRHPPDRRRLAVRIALAEDDVVDLPGRQRRALHELSDHHCGQLCCEQISEDATEAADGGSQRFTDHRIAHGGSASHRGLAR